MSSDGQNSFVESMKGKIIIAFLLIALSLGLMWVINQVAFQKITTVVNDLSTPNEKLQLSRKLLTEVSNLPHLQRLEVIKGNRKPSPPLVKENAEIESDMKELALLFSGDRRQKMRLDSISGLMKLSNKLFLDYLRLGFTIAEKKVFERELDALSEKIDSEQVDVDSSVVTSERKVKTTTIIHPDTQPKPKAKQPWLKRIFRKPKKETATVAVQPKVIIEEEFNTTVDTVAISKQDSTLANLGTSLRKIEKGRVRRSNQLRESEQELLKANDVLLHKVLGILNEVERQELEEVKAKTESAKLVANNAINTTRLIMILFILLAVVLIVLLLADLSRSRSYRKELEIAKAEAEYHSQAKQRFLTNMSHEIRTPLQSIIGYTEQQLQNETPDPDAIQAVYSSSQHLLQIVNEVLDYSRIISGRFNFENKPFLLREVIEEVAAGMRLLAEKKSLQLVVKVEDQYEGYLSGDAFRLKQVLYNLLGNAIKFTDKGSITLLVNGVQQGKEAQYTIVVEDTGIGIERVDIEHIFGQFEQVSNPVTRLQNGTGLGLSIVKELVEAQHGSISVDSKPGKGSRFEVQLAYPLETSIQITGAITDEAAPVQFTGTVWIVDDDSLILNLASLIFRKHGIQHRTFSSSEQLLAMKWDDEVTLVLTDIRLPGLSGIELCNELRNKAQPNLRIIALTAQALPEEKQTISQGCFDGLLIKPFTESDLVGLLQDDEMPLRKIELDLSSLRMMVDEEQLLEILQQCYHDTVNDRDELVRCTNKSDVETGSLIIHRLAGRMGQVGEKELAKKLREWENDLRKDGAKEKFPEIVNELLPKLDKFLELLDSMNVMEVKS